MPMVSLPNDHLLQLLALVLLLATFGVVVQADVRRTLKPTAANITTGVVNLIKAPLEAALEVVPTQAPQALAVKADSAARESTAVRRMRYSPHVVAAARASKVDAALIHAVISAESAYDPAALSRTGAVGLMQLMPATAQRYGVTDPWDPEQNIHGGTRYLRDLLRRFPNNLKLTIAAYNAGEGAVAKYGNRIPPYRETRSYVPKVMAYYKEYRATS